MKTWDDRGIPFFMSTTQEMRLNTEPPGCSSSNAKGEWVTAPANLPAWFVFSVVMILVFAMAARTPVDSDMWWHLRAGEATWLTGKVVTTDSFSYTRAGQTWVNHSWLSQVGMYLLFKIGGYLALSTAVAILATLSMALTYHQMSGPPLIRSFLLILAAVVAAVVWSPRPQITSLVLFALVGYVLFLFKWRQKDRLWLLPLIFILWSNLHAGYVLGLMLIGTMIAGEVLNHLLGYRQEEVISWRGILQLIAWGTAGGVLVIVNPNGIAMWLVPFKTVGIGILQGFVSEWASPDFHQVVQQPLLWLFFSVLAAVGISSKHLDGSDLVGVIFFAYLAFVARRNYGPFALVTAPVLARHTWWAWQNREAHVRASFRDMVTRHSKRKSGLPEEPEDQRRQTGNQAMKYGEVINLALLAVFMLSAIFKLYLVTTPEFVSQSLNKLYPVYAVQWIEANQPAGQMFNDYNWGGYLLWSLRNYPVFVDGRTDLYDDDILEQYIKVMNGDEGWDTILNHYGVNFVIIAGSSGLVRELNRNPSWVKAYQDTVAVVYKRVQ